MKERTNSTHRCTRYATRYATRQATSYGWKIAAIATVSLPLQNAVVLPVLAQSSALASATSGAPTQNTQTRYAQLTNDNINVTLNGRAINFGNVAPLQQSGRVLVPLRGVFEALGAFVDYNDATQTITATQGQTRVQLTIGSARASVNGQTRTLDVPAQVQQGRTLVPLRFVSEALGANVLWNPAQRTVLITTVALPDNGNNGGIDNGNAARTVSGSVTRVDDLAPGSVTVRVLDSNSLDANSGRTQTFPLAADARLFRRTTGRLVRGQTPNYGATDSLGSPLTRLFPGDDVTLQVSANGEATRITSSVSLVSTRIRDVQSDQVILDDTLGTTLTVGPDLRVLDSRGRQTSDASTLAPGQRIALFIAPSTRRVWLISAQSSDLADADSAGNISGGDNTLPDDGTLPDNGTPTDTPQISLVQQNATRALRSGQTLTVTARGTAAQRASFSVLPDVPEVAMTEDPSRPGVYTGTYLVQSGDNVLNGRVNVYLRNRAGREAFKQSQTSLTIDTTAPRITTTSPATGATISSSQSNILINASDLGGSGLASATVSFNGESVSPDEITVSSNSVSVIAPDNLSGQVTVNVTVLDRAGNSARKTFSYFVDGNRNGNNGNNSSGDGILSLTHNATRDTQSGDRVTVNLRAAAGGTATFDVLGSNGASLVRNIRMTEIADGRYRSSFTVPTNSGSQLTIRARYTDSNGQVSTEDTTAPIAVDSSNDNGDPTALTISTPRDSATVGTNFIARGTAEPNATVEVSVVAQGTRYYIFEYNNDLGTQQVQADNNGNWATRSIELPAPNNVSNLRYVVTATQTDGANRRSEPISVTVTPRSTNNVAAPAAEAQ